MSQSTPLLAPEPFTVPAVDASVSQAVLIDAHVIEIGGPYYRVRLSTIPRVGELISLWCHQDHRDGRNPVHRFQVVQVVHDLLDVADGDVPPSPAHFVTVHVHPAQSSFFSR